ncbi:NPF8.5 [Symbiodinium sp. CCMP2592]|nr:NPF8.5 [Symbiodinium sp. CCMP2592]
MESSLPFRTWMQDLMLWTICTDMEPHQQCAAIISQLGGSARELARTITPQEVYHGGVINGRQLDPVSYLLHGLSTRFAPLDEETRLRAAQDLLAFGRRHGETVDALVSRFEITRQRARTEGGGALSVETASLLLLRACGVNSEQFQALTQPFGLRMPSTEQEYAQMCHHLRRMGHIVERHPNNIASGLRGHSSAHQSFLAEADTGSSGTGEQATYDWPSAGMGAWSSAESTDWAFAAMQVEGASDTDTGTSSDNDEPMDVSDLQGMSTSAVDEYLFGEYQNAKRKGKGKGKQRSYVNLNELFQQSAYFKGLMPQQVIKLRLQVPVPVRSQADQVYGFILYSGSALHIFCTPRS